MNLTSVSGILFIGINSDFHLISGFANLVSVIRCLSLCFSDVLIDNNGFEKLASIGEILIMSPNETLYAIDGFPNIHSLDDDLANHSNKRL